MDFSVIIPACNNVHTLPLVLRCLAVQQGYSRDAFEVIVVDDGSTDGTAAFLENCKTPFQMTVVRHSTRLGASMARNTGYARSTGDILLFLDADMLTPPTWIAGYAQGFPGLAVDVVSGARYSLALPNDCADISTWLCHVLSVSQHGLLVPAHIHQQFESLHKMASRGQYPEDRARRRDLDSAEACVRYPKSVVPAYCVITSNVAVTRRAFSRTSGFDPFMRRGQDSELALRLWELGCAFSCIDCAPAYHLYRINPARDRTREEWLAFLYRHPYRLVWALSFREPGDSLLTFADAPASAPALEHVRRIAGDQIQFRFSEEQLERHIVASLGMDSGRARQCLVAGVKRGILSDERADNLRFDSAVTTNWIRERFCMQAQPYRKPGHRPLPAYSVYSGHWSVELSCDETAAARTLIQLEFPVPRGAIHDFRCTGAQNSGTWDAASHVFRNVLFTGRGSGSLSFSGARDPAWLTDSETAPLQDCSTISYPDIAASRLRYLLDCIGEVDNLPDIEKARRIYSWLSTYVLHRDNCFSDTFILEAGFGDAFQRARLFANLCRYARIPATEHIGAVLAPDCNQDGSFSASVRGVAYNPLAGVWVEVNARRPDATRIHFDNQNLSWADACIHNKWLIETGVPGSFARHARISSADGDRPSSHPVVWPMVFSMTVVASPTAERRGAATNKGASGSELSVGIGSS